MLIVRVELHCAVSGEQTEIARMMIDNIGGTKSRGDYRARTLAGRGEEALDHSMFCHSPPKTTRQGQVLNHQRLREHVWNLVAKALKSVKYGEPS